VLARSNPFRPTEAEAAARLREYSLDEQRQFEPSMGTNFPKRRASRSLAWDGERP
jgi:hypothetical protein